MTKLTRLLAFVLMLISLPVAAQVLGGPVVSGNALGITTSGAVTSGHCSQFLSSSIVVDSGSACGGGGGSTSLSALTSATGANTIDSTSFAQTWQWGTLSTQTAFTLSAPALTTGTVLSLVATGNANALTITGNCVGCSQINALYYTTTSRTIASTDVNNLITYNSSSAGAWTLPAAGSAGFTAPNNAMYINSIGTGALTLTATGGSVLNGLGASTTASIGQNQWAYCIPDASNNWDCIGATGSAAGTINSSSSGHIAVYSGSTTLSGSANLFQSTTTTSNIGIGTSTPGALLDIEGSANGTFTVGSSNTVATSFTIQNTSSGGKAWALAVSGTGGAGPGGFSFGDSTDNDNPFGIYGGTSNTGSAGFIAKGVLGWSATSTYVNGTWDTGISRSAADTLAFGNGSQNNTSAALIGGSFNSGGTKFTASGCTSISSTSGGATAGEITIGANSCTITVTLQNTATNGWACFMNVLTAGLVIPKNGGSTTTATFAMPSGASASDVVEFACVGY